MISISNRTTNEQREITQKGGKASGKARRRKRDLKACANLLLDLPASFNSDYDILNTFALEWENMSKEEINNKFVVMAALIQKAKTGDVSAIKELRYITQDDYQFKAKLALEKQKLKLLEERLHGGGDEEALAKLDEVLGNIKGVI